MFWSPLEKEVATTKEQVTRRDVNPQRLLGADPETNKPIKCDSQNKRVSNEVFEGISAKQLGIFITEERNDLITRFDHALYLGRELQKAEECLYKKLPYIQD